MIKTPTYVSWQNMRNRCSPFWPDAHLYSQRGITVCERWRSSFQNFLNDMGERPSGMTLDRYPDNKGNYEPGNCRWATPVEQARNRRTNRIVRIDGEAMPLVSAMRFLGISTSAYEQRVHRGLPPSMALLLPRISCRGNVFAGVKSLL